MHTSKRDPFTTCLHTLVVTVRHVARSARPPSDAQLLGQQRLHERWATVRQLHARIAGLPDALLLRDVCENPPALSGLTRTATPRFTCLDARR
jgi:hypothetical protein